MNVPNKISDYKIKNINRVLQSNDYYVGHEYLEAINDPVYVSEFIERAQEQSCAYIGDETLNRPSLHGLIVMSKIILEH